MDCRCNQCGKNWTSKVDNPKSCPFCKRYDWKAGKKHGAGRPRKDPREIEEAFRASGAPMCPMCGGILERTGNYDTCRKCGKRFLT